MSKKDEKPAADKPADKPAATPVDRPAVARPPVSVPVPADPDERPRELTRDELRTIKRQSCQGFPGTQAVHVAAGELRKLGHPVRKDLPDDRPVQIRVAELLKL